MIFKDEARALIFLWEQGFEWLDETNLASRTAAVLGRLDVVPRDVLEALDGIMNGKDKRMGSDVYTVTRYLRSLADENKPQRNERQLILTR